MTQDRILQKEPITQAQRARIEEFTRSYTSKVKSGMEKHEFLRLLNLDLGSLHVFMIKGDLEKDGTKPEGTEFNYMVNGISLFACATKGVEDYLTECNYGDYIKIILAPNSFVVLDIAKL